MSEAVEVRRAGRAFIAWSDARRFDSPATVRRTASANIAEDGRFEMFMRKPGDGVVPGKYVVTFTVLDKPMGGTSLILPKYTKGVESPYVLEVDGDKTGLLYELEKL